MREAIEVTISDATVRYNHVVRLRTAAVEAAAEQGTGTIDGQKINLQGSWKSGARQYEAKHSGSFVRRNVKLMGHADLDRRRQDRDPCLRGQDQAAVQAIPAAQEVGGCVVRS